MSCKRSFPRNDQSRYGKIGGSGNSLHDVGCKSKDTTWDVHCSGSVQTMTGHKVPLISAEPLLHVPKFEVEAKSVYGEMIGHN